MRILLGSLPHQIAYRGSLAAPIVNEQIELYGMTYGTYVYIHIHMQTKTHADKGGVLIVSVGLAQARPNNNIRRIPFTIIRILKPTCTVVEVKGRPLQKVHAQQIMYVCLRQLAEGPTKMAAFLEKASTPTNWDSMTIKMTICYLILITSGDMYYFYIPH